MKVTQISEHIWSCRMWLGIPIHVWLVKEEEGITLVDAGLGIMVKGILKAVQQLHSGPLVRIVLTHGHPDHIGGLKRLWYSNSVPTYAHRIEIPYMQGDISYREGKKPVTYVEKGRVVALDQDENGTLLPIGSLMPYLTPGHSPGHVVYFHVKDGVLMAGDLFSSRNGRLRVAPFTPNVEESVRSSSIIRMLQPKRVEVCHGNSVPKPADQLEQYMTKYS